MEIVNQQQQMSFMKKYELNDSNVNGFLEKNAFEFWKNTEAISKAKERYRTFSEMHEVVETVSRDAFMDERKNLDQLIELENSNEKLAAIFRDFIPLDFLTTIVLPVKGEILADRSIAAFTVKRDPATDFGIVVSTLT